MNDDLISRQAAIDAICKHGTALERRGILVLALVEHKQMTIDLLEDLPSAQPERETGTWMLKRVRDDGHGTVTFQVICSKCGEPAYEFNQPYCHHCGAKMND